ncbi:hypothetical protein JD844_006121 [Phrynosoma platyrhinos]|uniref:BTB domain-containing protein n=1 Tax=Phrynosoma platyrhinos TaxID=52577 RepID=A0ABQ7TQN1_PHRPL|nr:hypothetical protein JD844_006121 [Phrynosoma platyrhinos]
MNELNKPKISCGTPFPSGGRRRGVTSDDVITSIDDCGSAEGSLPGGKKSRTLGEARFQDGGEGDGGGKMAAKAKAAGGVAEPQVKQPPHSRPAARVATRGSRKQTRRRGRLPFNRRSKMATTHERLQFRFPSYGDSVLRRMDQLRQQRRFCDVTVQVNELRVPGHRVVFAACSPFLRDQFLLNDSPEVSVSLFQSPEIGQQLLLSCYTGMLEVPVKELVNYLTAASFLQMGHVVELCAQAVSRYLVPKADALLRVEQGEGSDLQQGGEEEGEGEEEEEEEEEKQPSSLTAEADSEESKEKGAEFTPRGSRGPSSPAISLSLINSAVEITRSYLQGCYNDEASHKRLPFPSEAPTPTSQWKNCAPHRHRHSTAVAYRDWKAGLRRHLKEMHGKSTVQNSHEEIEEVTVGFD